MKNLNWFLLQQQHHQFIMVNAGKQVISWKQKAKGVTPSLREMREIEWDCDLILGWTHHPPELLSRRRLTHDSTNIESFEEVNLMILRQEAKMWWCVSRIGASAGSSYDFQKYSTCWVFKSFCLCLCLCLCLEVDSGCHEQGTSQPIYITAMGNLNLYTLTHSSWKFVCLCLCICLCLCTRHHGMIEDIASLLQYFIWGVWHDPGMIYKALDVI